MTTPSHHDAFKELVRLGHLAGHAVPLPLQQGNLDRKESATRSSWVVFLPSGQKAKLTLGRDLSVLAARHAAIAQACPEITTQLLGQVHLPGQDALWESFFEGTSLESAAADDHWTTPLLHQGLHTICVSLVATERPSTEAARLAEWQTWIGELLALPVWQSGDVSTLRELLLPQLYQTLTHAPARIRWSNGDFLPGNILINTRGEARLIDAEFATPTHFFDEDTVRFQVLSTVVRQRPELQSALTHPQDDLAWHLYFWLRQLQLEVNHNTTSYWQRVRSSRLGLVRRIAEHLFSTTLPQWQVPPLAVEYRLEETRLRFDSQDSAKLSGWCHVPSAERLLAITAINDTGQIATVAPTTREDVQRHFQGALKAAQSGFALEVRSNALTEAITLCAEIDVGTLIPFHTLTPADLHRGTFDWSNYSDWSRLHDPDPPAPALAARLPGPLISILLPVYQTPLEFLRECLVSVVAQHYPQWELCVVDDGSCRLDLTDMLATWAADDPRVRVQSRTANHGISRSTNEALAMARGEFIVLLDHDDLLRPHALAEFVDRLTRQPGLDAIYSDEDKITAEGLPVLPFLKPDFSPEFLLGVMYIGHALCVRTAVARRCGGFDPVYDGVQDYEFFLRVTEHSHRIAHLPRILYHWRQSPGSSALHGNVKGNMDEKQAAAVQAHLQRIGDTRQAVAMGGHRVRLRATVVSSTEVVRLSAPASALNDLHASAKNSLAEVLVLAPPSSKKITGDSLRDLAALASIPSSGFVAPLLVSPENRVLESGRSAGVALMAGFPAESDGYNGSLCCNREVDAVSPLGVAVRRKLILETPVLADETWNGYCARLRAKGLYHRICASAWIVLPSPPQTPREEKPKDPDSREFYHPLFNAQRGDYSLQSTNEVHPPSPSEIAFHIDQPAQWLLGSRCLIVRGWCFATNGRSIEKIRLLVGKTELAAALGFPRPDVKTARPDAPGNDTGFEIRGIVPAGHLKVCLQIQLTGEDWQTLQNVQAHAPQRKLPLWLGGGDWTELMFFQMPGHGQYPPRPLRMEKFPAHAASSSARPKLTVVTPSYGQARFLHETMQSVLTQPIIAEYVVQDGGSTDGSEEIIRQLASQLHAWESAPDGGQADAIVRGFARTSGGPHDVMAWINSDDFYLPGTFAFIVDYFARHPEVDVVYGHRIVVDEESQEIARWFLPQHDPEVLRLNDFVPQETMFWRRRIWDQVGGIDPAFKFALDWDILLRFQAAGAKIVRVPYFLACFRVHAAQKTTAQMHSIGQTEITHLRERTFDRPFPATELESNSTLLRYLRRSSLIEFLWKLGFRCR